MAVDQPASLFDADFLAHQRTRLQDERRRRAAVAAALEAEIADLSRGETPGLPIEAYGTSETASIEMDRARDQRSSAVARLVEIDAAFDRLRSGHYGRCERCGRSIERERLEAVPTATRCITCQAHA